MGLETVEIVMAWEEIFQISVSDADAVRLETPAMAIDYFCQRLAVPLENRGSCHALRSFHLLRMAIVEASGAARSQIRLSTPIKQFYKSKSRQEFWQRLRERTGFAAFKEPSWFSTAPTVGHLLDLLLRAPLPENQQWNRSRIRSAVRATIREYVGWRFSDNDHFIRDLGLD